MLTALIERFAQKAPLSVMSRALMENALSASRIDALFERTAESGYCRQLLFSHLVDLMTVVVCKLQPAVYAALKFARLPASATAVYNKLQRIEPVVLESLLRDVFARLHAVIREMKGELPGPIPGYESLVLDGNHLASTERRLRVLWECWAGPLPGTALVFFNPQLKLMSDCVLIEDGHAQERSRTAEILTRLKERVVLIADRNFCTLKLLLGAIKRGAFFVIRHHANMPVELVGERVWAGKNETGNLYEQAVKATFEKETVQFRRVTTVLTKKTRNKDDEIHVLSNLPSEVSAETIAGAYRSRWSIETAFQDLTLALNGEIDTLGYPRAALFGFTVALIAYNILSTMRAAIRVAWGVEMEEKVSEYYLANEVRHDSGGLDTASDEPDWEFARKATAGELAAFLVSWAKRIDLKRLSKAKRGVKKPVPPRTKYKGVPHVSTAKLLAAQKQREPH